jgi:hypothetical protein
MSRNESGQGVYIKEEHTAQHGSPMRPGLQMMLELRGRDSNRWKALFAFGVSLATNALWERLKSPLFVRSFYGLLSSDSSCTAVARRALRFSTSA